MIYSFDEFHVVIKGEDIRLNSFFDKLYFSSNSFSKNKNLRAQVKKQLLYVCYFLCRIRNKFVNIAKEELMMYLDSTSVSNASIDTLADLGIISVIMGHS